MAVSSEGQIFGGGYYELSMLPHLEPSDHLDLTIDEQFFNGICISGDRLYVRTGSECLGHLTCYCLKEKRIIWRNSYDFGNISDLTVCSGRLSSGYLVINVLDGKVIVDLRKLCKKLNNDIFGFTYMDEYYLYTSIDIYNENEGCVRYEFDSGEIFELNQLANSRVRYFDSTKILYKKKEIVVLCHAVSCEPIWECELDSEDSSVFVFNYRVYCLDASVLRVFNLCDGEVINCFELKDSMSKYTDLEDLFVYSFCISDDVFVICKRAQMDSWITVFDVVSGDVRYHRKDRDIQDLSICGDYIFYCNGSSVLQALDKNENKVVWASSELITSRKIISNSNYLVSGFFSGGFTIFSVV